jgi:coatomer subunit beta
MRNLCLNRDLVRYLKFFIQNTNMCCLTPESSVGNECNFLAANLYARSIFGEDILANICIEKESADGNIGGHVRLRSKTQGIALSLGEKITSFPKESENFLITS